jgi:deoxyribonuclease V
MFDLKKAARVQQKLSSRLILEGKVGRITHVAGADFSYHEEKSFIGAVIVVGRMPELEIIEVASEIQKVRIPYIPGYLNFREGTAFIRAFRKLKVLPSVTLIDGNGIAHPRRMGLASYIGVVLDIPTIGCAKSAFFPYELPPEARGTYSIYRNKGQEKVGFCLRTRSSVKPVFVSPGHMVDFEFARELVLACSRYRIPEPLRAAHRLAKELFCGKAL